MIGNLEKGILFLNKCCNEYQRDEAISNAVDIMNEVDRKNNEKIIDCLMFDELEDSNKKEMKESLSSKLATANKKINEMKKQ